MEKPQPMLKQNKFLTLIVIIILISSCSIFRKVVKSEDIIRTTNSISIDTTKKAISSNEILTSLIEKIDLSKAVITEYTSPDSNGKQSIIRTIEFNNNISTKQSTKKDITVKYDEKKGVITAVRDSTSEKRSTKIESKTKVVSGFWSKFIIASIILILIFIFRKKILLLFK